MKSYRTVSIALLQSTKTALKPYFTLGCVRFFKNDASSSMTEPQLGMDPKIPQNKFQPSSAKDLVSPSA